MTTSHRVCGSCTLCCRLVPVETIGKKAGQRCQYQSYARGCKVYHTSAKPPECSLWQCRWLTGNGTEALVRPDRTHYVIDEATDSIRITREDGTVVDQQALQVWCDPAFPLAYRDPALQRYIMAIGMPVLVRFDGERTIAIVPPDDAHEHWREVESNLNRDMPGNWKRVEEYLKS